MIIAPPSYKEEEEIDFARTIQLLNVTCNDDQMDQQMQKAWADQGFREFDQLFSLAMPNAYE